MAAKRLVIYRSAKHLLITFLFLIIPLVFLLLFTKLENVSLSILVPDLTISFFRLLAAYLIAVLLGWGAAVLFYKGKRAEVALPVFDVLQSFPTFALLPLAIFLWGPTNFTVIFFLVTAVIWPILFSIVSSLKLIKTDWQEAVEISGLSGFSYFRYFLLPVSIPGLITGSIVGLGDGWEALIATEIIVGVKQGLGSFFSFFSTSPVITAFGVLGFLLFVFSINKLVWLRLLDWSHRMMEE